MLAVVPVRDGVLPAGGSEAIAECAGRVLIVGSVADRAVDNSAVTCSHVRLVDVDDFAPAAWAAMVAELVADESILVLPASPDGRDLAARLAMNLDVELLAGAI